MSSAEDAPVEQNDIELALVTLRDTEGASHFIEGSIYTTDATAESTNEAATAGTEIAHLVTPYDIRIDEVERPVPSTDPATFQVTPTYINIPIY
jgi:hypothetical protein